MSLLVVCCSKQQTTTSEDGVAENTPFNTAQLKPKTALNIIIEPRVGKGLHGDLTKVGFTIQQRPWQPILKGRLICTVMDSQQLTCYTEDSLAKLTNGYYRIIVHSHPNITGNTVKSDGFACDYFEYKKNEELNIKITPDSSGECILWQLKSDTGLSEAEIRTRVRHILRADDNETDYDLELTLYDLYRYYNNKYDWNKAWEILVDAIKTKKPLSAKAPASKINAAGMPLF